MLSAQADADLIDPGRHRLITCVRQGPARALRRRAHGWRDQAMIIPGVNGRAEPPTPHTRRADGALRYSHDHATIIWFRNEGDSRGRRADGELTAGLRRPKCRIWSCG